MYAERLTIEWVAQTESSAMRKKRVSELGSPSPESFWRFQLETVKFESMDIKKSQYLAGVYPGFWSSLVCWTQDFHSIIVFRGWAEESSSSCVNYQNRKKRGTGDTCSWSPESKGFSACDSIRHLLFCCNIVLLMHFCYQRWTDLCAILP